MNNSTDIVSCASYSPWPSSCLSIVVAILMIVAIVSVMLFIVGGNLLVILAVYHDGKLRLQRQNWLIVSLAFADLLVGAIVMPLTLQHEIIGEWRLGDVLCELWLALDVLFVTGSILHICAISIDRYWSVTAPLTYPQRRTTRRIGLMIGTAWLVSLCICMPPLFGWRHDRRPNECSLSTDINYVLYSAAGSFYIPVVVISAVYARIYYITRRHNQKRMAETQRAHKTLLQLANNCEPESPSTTCAVTSTTPDLQHHRTSGYNTSRANSNTYRGGRLSMDDNRAIDETLVILIDNNGTLKADVDYESASARKTSIGVDTIRNILNQFTMRKKVMKPPSTTLVIATDAKDGSGNHLRQRRRQLKAKERQATLVLTLVLGAFIASWLPFFSMYVLSAIGYTAPDLVFKFFFWLGYTNSGINPVIYAIANRQFKRAMTRQLERLQSCCCQCSNINDNNCKWL